MFGRNRIRILRVLGLFYLVLGASVLLNSFQGITGFVIFESASVSWGYFLGVLFVLIGAVVISISGREREYSLEYLLSYKPERTRRPILVLDRAGFVENRDYIRKADSREFKDTLDKYGRIVVPSYLQNHMDAGNRNVRELCNRTERDTIPEEYEQVAKYILDHSGKTGMRNALIGDLRKYIDLARLADIGKIIDYFEKKGVDYTTKKLSHIASGERLEEESEDMRSSRAKRFALLTPNDKKKLIDESENNYTHMNSKEKKKLRNTLENIESTIPRNDFYKIMSAFYRNKNGLNRNEFIDLSDLYNYLEEWKEDPEDVEVLATALYELRKQDDMIKAGKLDKTKSGPIALYAHDIDMEDAIKLVLGWKILEKLITKDYAKFSPAEKKLWHELDETNRLRLIYMKTQKNYIPKKERER